MSIVLNVDRKKKGFRQLYMQNKGEIQAITQAGQRGSLGNYAGRINKGLRQLRR